MKNKGISLITLIITIIIIIILALIVMFSGLQSIDSANFARFCSEISDFNDAISHHFNSIVQKNYMEANYRTDEQIYYRIASGVDVGMDGTVVVAGKVEDLKLNLLPEKLYGTEYYEITDDKNVLNWGNTKKYYAPTEKHYVTNKGEAFILPGYMYKINEEERWYINSKLYYIGNGIYVSGEQGKEPPKEESGESPKPPEKENIVSIASVAEVGDYINYNAFVDNSSFNITRQESGYNTNQSLNTENVNWKVLSVNTSTGEVLITTENSVNSGVYFKGIEGYFNGPNILNNACQGLYSSNSLGVKARSLTIDDINKICNFNKSDIEPKHYALYGNAYMGSLSGTYTHNGINYTKVRHVSSLGLGSWGGKFFEYDYSGTTDSESGHVYAKSTFTDNVLVTDNYYSYNPNNYNSKFAQIIGSSSNYLASNCYGIKASGSEYYEFLGIYNAKSSMIESLDLYISDDEDKQTNAGLRPIISLDSNIKVDISDSSKDGSSYTNSLQIAN